MSSTSKKRKADGASDGNGEMPAAKKSVGPDGAAAAVDSLADADEEDKGIVLDLEDDERDGGGGGPSEVRPTESDEGEDDDELPTKTSTNDVQTLNRKKFRLPAPPNCGMLLFCGGTSWDILGRKPKNAKAANGRNLWGPHRLLALSGIRVRVAVSGNSACHSVIITEDGKVMSWGRNDKGQLGHGDTKRRDSPLLVEGLQDVVAVDAACGRSHTLVLTDRGHVYSFGDNKLGQCGVGIQTSGVMMPSKIAYKGRPIVKLGCGGEFSMIVDVKGNVYSFGCPEYGQLGHNTDGRYFVTSNRLAYRCEQVPRRVVVFLERTREGHVLPLEDVQIISIACGVNHTVAMDNKKRCYSWGFGGYGRLGHSEPKDEMVPRLIKFFDGPNRGVTAINAGSTYSLAVNEHGCLYFWGQNKMAGDATMYPKPVHDLTGWRVKATGCSNKSIVVLADESVVSWGPSPTYGELGYGDNKAKSSTTPQEVKLLEGVHVHDVSCGFGHTLLVVRDETDEEKAKLNKFPEFSP